MPAREACLAPTSRRLRLLCMRRFDVCCWPVLERLRRSVFWHMRSVCRWKLQHLIRQARTCVENRAAMQTRAIAFMQLDSARSTSISVDPDSCILGCATIVDSDSGVVEAVRNRIVNFEGFRSDEYGVDLMWDVMCT